MREKEGKEGREIERRERGKGKKERKNEEKGKKRGKGRKEERKKLVWLVSGKKRDLTLWVPFWNRF